MKEYCIYIIRGSASPYTLGIYKNIYDAKDALNNILKLYNNRRKIFFVDNDYFENIYPNSVSGDYYCIKERDVSEWIDYREFNINNNENNKILEFNRFL